MKQYELTKDALGLKAGQVFIQDQSGNYWNMAHTCQLASMLVENDKESFKQLEDLSFFEPFVGETFYIVSIDGGSPSIVMRPEFSQAVMFGNAWESEDHAKEVATEFSALIRKFQKKFYTGRPKRERPANLPAAPEMPPANQPTPPVNQQPTPPVVQPQPQAPARAMPRFIPSVFNPPPR